MAKSFEKMDFEELVSYFLGLLILAIGSGGGPNAQTPRSVMWLAMQTAGQWREAYREREKTNED